MNAEQITSIYDELMAAYGAHYRALSAIQQATREKILAQYRLRDTEMALIASGADSAGRNAEQRSAIIWQMTAAEREELRKAEGSLAEAEAKKLEADRGLAIAKAKVELARAILDLYAATQRQAPEYPGEG